MSNTLTKLRYRYWPDHVFGELLQKQWMETAVPLLVLLLTIAFFSSRIDNFISVANLSDTLRQASELGFVVLGMSLVLIVGGIDLSVASVFALCNLTALYCINVLGLPTPAVIALTLLLGAVLGAVNGVLIGYMRMRAFLTTMVTLIVYKAIHDLLNFQLAVAISSVVPTATRTGCTMRMTAAGGTSSFEVTTQAASATRSLLVWSANLRNIFPRGWVIASGSGAISASPTGSQSPAPVTMPMPRPPKTASCTFSGCSSARKAEMRAPME